MPVTTASRTAMRTGTPCDVALHARTVADRAATEPTDRSLPAETITKVTPKARMAVTAACTPMLSRLSVVRKSPDSADIATTRRMSGVGGPLPSRRGRRPAEAPLAPVVLVSVSVATGGLHFVGAFKAGRCADGERHDRVLRGLGGGQFARDAALGHHQDPVTHAEH